MKSNYDNRLVFPENLENLFVKYITDRLRASNGVTVFEFREKVYLLAEKNNLNMPQFWETNRIAGKLMVNYFLKLHSIVL